MTAIQNNNDPAEKDIQLKVLKQYCDDQSSSTKNDSDFPNLLSTWSFAAQSNAEPVLSAVPASLAAFFRTISSELDFREFGLSLCHTLLKQDQLRFIEIGLSAPKFKEFLISPCLRLLTEIISFDGGALSGNVFARREVLLRRLDALLDTVPSHQDGTDRRRPTVRRNAERLLLALLKYLSPESKAELIGHGKAIYSCLRRLVFDGGDIVRELLDSFRQHILKADLPNQLKGRFLSSGNLSQLAVLYDFEPEDVDSEADGQPAHSIRETIHKFLLQVCTTQDGALLHQSGWYPSGFDFEASTWIDYDGIDLALDSPYYFDEYESAVPVRNANLSAFLQSLRPEKDTLQAELIVAIFDAAPELVADYFTKRPKFTSRPHDEAAWRGQVAFIFSVINLSVPHNCGAQDELPTLPPPMSVVVESILPRPMSRSAIIASLNSSDEITVMSAARLMTQALKKLNKVQKLFQSAHSSRDTWDQACQKLRESVAARIPTYQDFITALQKAPEAHVQARLAISECMVMYNIILPMSTVASKFDAAPSLMEAIGQLRFEETNEEDDLASLVTNMAELGRLSATMRWWYKPKPDQLSPLMSLIRVFVRHGLLMEDDTIREVINGVLYRAGIVRPEQGAADALVRSFYEVPEGENSERRSVPLHVYLFAENCMIRTSKQPVKYLDQLDTIQRKTSEDGPLSLLPICVAEQWPYFLKTSDLGMIKDLAAWVARLFGFLNAAGENQAILGDALRGQMSDLGAKEFGKALLNAFKYEDAHPQLFKQISHRLQPGQTTTSSAQGPSTDQKLASPDFPVSLPAVDLDSLFPRVTPPPSSLKGLTSWANPEFESELTPPISTSRVARLIHCLSSEIEEIRLQALQTLQIIMHALSTSAYAEKDQVYLLLGELCETARHHALTASTPSQTLPPHLANNASTQKERKKDPALPSVVTALVTLLLSIVTNPADKMYSKSNRFLMRGPTWTPVSRVIPYWVDQVLLQEPEVDEPYAWEAEVDRLLDVLIGGMRTEQDLDVYRRSGVFERLGSLYMSPALALTGKTGMMRKKILHVFANATEVGGGADTLITRVGVRSWLDMVGAREGEESEVRRIVEALKARLDQKCTKEYIRQWEDDRPIFREKATE